MHLSERVKTTYQAHTGTEISWLNLAENKGNKNKVVLAHFKNISQNGNLPQIGVNIKKV